MADAGKSLRASAPIKQSYVVYAAPQRGFLPFQWLGKWSKIGDQTSDLGSISTTQRLDTEGGTEQDTLLRDVKGTSDFEIVLKAVRGDELKSELIQCLWYFDSRLHCGKGADRASNTAWEEITRYGPAGATGRTLTESSMESEEESMVTLPMSGLRFTDIYKRVLTIVDDPVAARSVYLTAIDLANTLNCQGCEGKVLPTVYAVSSLEAAGSAYIFVNARAGLTSAWTSIAIPTWTTGGGADILALGKFGIAVSTVELGLIRTDDGYVSQTPITPVEVPDFTANAPTCIDAIDQTAVYIGGENGYIYGSFDNGRTFETIDAGVSSTDDVIGIHVARDNARVIWTHGVNNSLRRSTNGGVTFNTEAGPSVGNDLLAMHVKSANELLVIDDLGRIYASEDSAQTWVIQTELTDMPASPLTGASFSSPDPTVVYLSAQTATATALYQNIENGADGYWISPEGATFGAAQQIYDVAAIGVGKAISVGGDGTDITTIASLL